MEREIVVKGIGKITAEPDMVVVNINVERTKDNYAIGYKLFTKDIENLQNIICLQGFEKNDLKTGRIESKEEYEWIKQKNCFMGYKFSSNLKLKFDLEPEKLGRVLNAISKSSANFTTNVKFTVKDQEAVKNSLLGVAAKDAETKANILCKSLGAKLGQLKRISYNWDEVSIYSNTDYKMLSNIPCGAASESEYEGVDFSPEEIELTDDATFVWAIE